MRLFHYFFIMWLLTNCSIPKDSEQKSILAKPQQANCPSFGASGNNNLKVTQIRLDQEILNVELATTPEERATGLMGRSFLAEDAGMLFIYPKPQIAAFWMKNTRIPLDVGFFDADRRLIHIEQMDLPKKEPLPLYQCNKPALYALEVPRGWFERHRVFLLTRFEWEEKTALNNPANAYN